MTNDLGLYTEDKVEDITDLQYLKKYACPKNQHMREWYLKCLDCKSKHTCRAGKQAIFIMNSVTAPKESLNVKEPPAPIGKKEQEIRDIFTQKDPVRTLFDAMSPDSKAAAIYKKVNYWRTKYPHLDKEFHMMDKVRFLMTKPYDRMNISEAMEALYGKIKKEEKPVAQVKTAIAKEPEQDDISLEDFLDEVNEEKTEVPMKEQSTAGTGNASDMDILLKKLTESKNDLQAKIKEIDKQIEAIHTVQKLMATVT